LVLALVPAARCAAATKVGQPAPKFTAFTLDRHKLRLEDLRGKVVVINYWATWCVPCRTEMPLLDTMKRQWANKGLEVIAVTTEDSAPAAALKNVQNVLHFPIASRLSSSGYGIIKNAVPSNYVIDRAGTLRYAKAGAFDLDSVNALIVPLLDEPAPPAAAAPPSEN